MATTLCLLPFVWNGDVTQCHLPAGHPGDCVAANREARRLAAHNTARYGGAV